MYRLKKDQTRKLYQDLKSIVPIKFQIDNFMHVNAEMDFDEKKQWVVVKYKNIADEQIDIMHELLHARMQFREKFSLLAWRTDNPLIISEVINAVSNIRNVVDDTYIFYALYEEFNIFPISPNFFNECRKDNKSRKIHQIQSLTGINRVLVGSWRLRIARLALHDFSQKMTKNQKEICEEFLSLFSHIDSDIERTLCFIQSHLTSQSVSTPSAHGRALENLRDHIGYSSSLLYLAIRNKRGSNWVLEKI